MTRQLWLLAVALLVAGCSFFPGRQFVFGFPASGAVPELRGVLTDQTGTVTRVTTLEGMDPPPPIPRGMMTFVERPNSVLTHWIGGPCDESVAIAVTPDGGVTITVTTTVKDEPCDLVAVQRYAIVEFAGPVDASRTSVRFEP